MEHLFDEKTLTYSNVAIQIDSEIAQALEPIIRKWAKAEYNIREIGIIAEAAVNTIVLEHVLTYQVKLAKEKRSANRGQEKATSKS